jgi:hypothetical protein
MVEARDRQILRDLPITGIDGLIEFFASNGMGQADHRLERLLRETSGYEGIKIPLDIGLQFGVRIPGGSSLCREFEDQTLYDLHWGGDPSYQGSHFLTAVALSYYNLDTGFSLSAWLSDFGRRFGAFASSPEGYAPRLSNTEIAIRAIVGHELLADERGIIRGIDANLQQTVVADTVHVYGFMQAVAYDVQGNAAGRDQILESILNLQVEGERRGNSLEDMRLSVKGWIFGHHIRAGIIHHSTVAGAWLRDNLVGP